MTFCSNETHLLVYAYCIGALNAPRLTVKKAACKEGTHHRKASTLATLTSSPWLALLHHPLVQRVLYHLYLEDLSAFCEEALQYPTWPLSSVFPCETLGRERLSSEFRECLSACLAFTRHRRTVHSRARRGSFAFGPAQAPRKGRRDCRRMTEAVGYDHSSSKAGLQTTECTIAS